MELNSVTDNKSKIAISAYRHIAILRYAHFRCKTGDYYSDFADRVHFASATNASICFSKTRIDSG